MTDASIWSTICIQTFLIRSTKLYAMHTMHPSRQQLLTQQPSLLRTSYKKYVPHCTGCNTTGHLISHTGLQTQTVQHSNGKKRKEKEKKRKDYAFRRQFNEKPSIIPGCPEFK